MDTNKFSEAITNQVTRCMDLLLVKSKEYDDNKSIDRLNHFKVAAAFMEVPQETALLGMLSKHLASIGKMCMAPKGHSLATWDEKITDSINYLLILSAMVRENEDEENRNPNAQL